ncbi:hypothetical protein JW897_17795 [Chromobacterium alkanivorans]|uniref:hypothetical protein n=1 Tax=Chromobacterium alkanivorans TaxID=1071719 RepID=UPI00196714BB|nr:hypothetical protein [Chromobacterium alkanivorans]MBN3005589.1 hypothetical protein [Chromobacterium alkanivorans]
MLESQKARSEAQILNPLVGKSTVDTIENLCQCLDKLGVSMSSQHGDNSIFFFCSSVAAALKFEAGQLKNQGKPASVRTIPPVRLASGS